MAYYPDEAVQKEIGYSEERAYEDAPSRLGQVAPSKLPLSEQEKSIANLHATIKQLEQRLSMVLGPNYPSDQNETKQAEEAEVSSLARQLHANNRGINRASQQITQLMERLEC